MTKATMIKNYRMFNASDAYLIGFIIGKMLYVVEVAKLLPRWIKIDHSAHSHGYKAKLDLDIKAVDRDRLIANNLLFTCPVSELYAQPCKNRGRKFESLIWNYFGQTGYDENDRIGFWHDGDITVNGIKYQLKMNNAQIVVEQTLETLKDFKRLGVTPPETFYSNIRTIVERLKTEKKMQKA